MTLEEIGILSNIAAALAVMGSLIFVGLQVRQANRMMKDAAIRLHAEKIQSISQAMFEVPGLADVFARGGADISKLSLEERIRFINFCTYILRILEQLHLQREMGLMDKELWEANIKIIRDIHQLPGFASAWEIRRHTLSVRFQKFYEHYVKAGEAKSLYGAAPAFQAETPMVKLSDTEI